MSVVEIDLGKRALRRCDQSRCECLRGFADNPFCSRSTGSSPKTPGGAFQAEEDQETVKPDPPPLEADQEPTPLPTILAEEEQNRLVAHQAARHNWYTKGGEQQREVRGLYLRLPISESAPLTQMRLPCDMVEDQFILAIKPIMWLMEESSGSSLRLW